MTPAAAVALPFGAGCRHEWVLDLDARESTCGPGVRVQCVRCKTRTVRATDGQGMPAEEVELSDVEDFVERILTARPAEVLA